MSHIALQSHEETALPNHPSTTARLTAVQSYLEEEFPGHVEEAKEDGFIISHHGMRHRVVFQPSFLHLCPDYMRVLRDSELTGHMREARLQARRFLVTWKEGDSRIRSRSL